MELKIISTDFMHTYIRIHENLVAYYANVLCQTFGIDPQKVTFAAYFHDHGKYRWNRDLFVKPKLSEEDWNVIKKHPKDGVEIVLNLMPERKSFLFEGSPSIADLIYLHHEKPDGSGYYGVKDIPIESAIVSISDIFDSCLSDRPYRKTMPQDQAVNLALEPYRDFLDFNGYSSDTVQQVLEKSAAKIAICSTRGEL